MKRILALLAGLIVCVSALAAPAEGTDEHDAVDVLGMSLQEYAGLNQNAPEEPAEGFPSLEPFILRHRVRQAHGYPRAPYRFPRLQRIILYIF